MVQVEDFHIIAVIFNNRNFTKIFFGLLAVFAQGDGVVTREEIDIVDHFVRYELNLSEQDRKMAIKFF